MFAYFSAERVLKTIGPHKKARFPMWLTNSLLYLPKWRVWQCYIPLSDGNYFSLSNRVKCFQLYVKSTARCSLQASPFRRLQSPLSVLRLSVLYVTLTELQVYGPSLSDVKESDGNRRMWGFNFECLHTHDTFDFLGFIKI